jgi:GNAT superfamily N-acetyltransferase
VAEIAQIRAADPSEADELDALHRRSSFVWEEDRPQLEAHPDALGVAREAIADGRVRVAVGRAGDVLGFATASPDGQRGCVLDDLFVEPALLRRGIGRALVQDAAARARADGCTSMTVVAHRRNFPFYESVGFAAEAPAPTRFGPATLMRRAL